MVTKPYHDPRPAFKSIFLLTASTDLVRRCWTHGVNPRVYNPFLEHGFEAAHGLDFHGGQKK